MKYLFLRRLTQISILVLFFVSNYYGVRILSGNLSSSVLFGIVPLSDPYAFLQLLLSGASFGASAIFGAIFVSAFYALFAPRVFCSWVCPINLLSDIAYKLRHIFGFNKDKKILIISKNTRYFILALSLVLSFVFSVPVFESVSYIGIVQRGIIFGGSAWIGVGLAIIVFDMFVIQRGICSHICPLGAFYALIGKFAFIRVKHKLSSCTKCMKCRLICPENQVLDLIGKRDGFVSNSECISCARCIDVCDDKALEFSIINLRRK